MIHDHIQTMERVLYGLTPTDVGRLASDVAVAMGTNHPFNQTNKLAGKNWLKRLQGRQSNLSVRQPQGTNLSRAVGFNRPRGNEFFGIYKDVDNRVLFGLTPTDVRRLTYDVAVATGTNHPFNQKNKLAGKGWLKSLLGT